MKLRVLIVGAEPDTISADGEVTATIGIGFHWNQRRKMKFPGEIIVSSGNVINIVDSEDYLKCVISSEMNPHAHPEFLRAHAIISRSWLYGKINKEHKSGCGITEEKGGNRYVRWQDTADHDNEVCDICNDDHCQRYQGYPESKEAWRAACKAVDETNGLVLRDKLGKVVDARFSKCCGGHTELFSSCWQDADPDYLQAFPDPWCDLSSMTADEKEMFLKTNFKDYDISTGEFYSWDSHIQLESISDNLAKLTGKDWGEIKGIYPIERGKSGRIKILGLNTSNGEIKVGKELTIRRLLSDNCLLSSAFEPTIKGPTLHMRGRGWGHGVGLCQTGAAHMAYKGFSAEQILNFYYRNAKIGK